MADDTTTTTEKVLKNNVGEHATDPPDDLPVATPSEIIDLTLSAENIVGFDFREATEKVPRDEVLLVLKEGSPLDHVIFTPDEFFSLFSTIFVMGKNKLGMKSPQLGVIFTVDQDTPTYNYLVRTKTQVQVLVDDYNALSKIVPEEKRSQYHLIFGGKIMRSASTYEEIVRIQNTELKNVLCKVYYPDVSKGDLRDM